MIQLDHERFKRDAAKAKAFYVSATGNANPDESAMMRIWLHAICYRHGTENKLGAAVWEKAECLKRFYAKERLPRYTPAKEKKDKKSKKGKKQEKKAKKSKKEKGDPVVNSIIEGSLFEDSCEESRADSDEDAAPRRGPRRGLLLDSDYDEPPPSEEEEEEVARAETDVGEDDYDEHLEIEAALRAESEQEEADACARAEAEYNKRQMEPDTTSDEEEDSLERPAKKKKPTQEETGEEVPVTRTLTVRGALSELRLDRLNNLAATAEQYMSTAHIYMKSNKPALFPYASAISRTHSCDYNTYEYREKLGGDGKPVEDLIKDSIYKALVHLAAKIQEAGETDLVPGNYVSAPAPAPVAPVAPQPVAPQPVANQYQPPPNQYQPPPAPQAGGHGAIASGFNLANTHGTAPAAPGAHVSGTPYTGSDRIYWKNVLEQMNIMDIIQQALHARGGGDAPAIFLEIQKTCGRNIAYRPRTSDERNYKVYTSTDDLEAMKVAVVKTMNDTGYPM